MEEMREMSDIYKQMRETYFRETIATPPIIVKKGISGKLWIFLICLIGSLIVAIYLLVKG